MIAGVAQLLRDRTRNTPAENKRHAELLQAADVMHQTVQAGAELAGLSGSTSGKAPIEVASSKIAGDRLCLDTFLDHAVRLWKQADVTREQKLAAAFHSWDANGDGVLQLEEWDAGLRFANPEVSRRLVANIYMTGALLVEHARLPKVAVEHHVVL